MIISNMKYKNIITFSLKVTLAGIGICIYYFYVFLSKSFDISIYQLTWAQFVIPVSVVIVVMGLFMLAYIVNAYAFRLSLEYMGYIVSYRSCWVLQGLFLPSKYLPGKIWLATGRLMLLKKLGLSFTEASFLLGINQICAIAASFAMGFLVLNPVIQSLHLKTELLIIFMILPLVIIHPRSLAIISSFIKRFFNKGIPLSGFSFRQSITLFLLKFIFFSILGLGYYVIVISYSLTTLTHWIEVIASFPLAWTIGLFAFFLPGGIGARELVLMGALKLNNLTGVSILVIVLAARIWCVIGDLILFATSMFFYKNLVK